MINLFDLTAISCDNEDRGDENLGLISLGKKKAEYPKGAPSDVLHYEIMQVHQFY